MKEENRKLRELLYRARLHILDCITLINHIPTLEVLESLEKEIKEAIESPPGREGQRERKCNCTHTDNHRLVDAINADGATYRIINYCTLCKCEVK